MLQASVLSQALRTLSSPEETKDFIVDLRRTIEEAEKATAIAVAEQARATEALVNLEAHTKEAAAALRGAAEAKKDLVRCEQRQKQLVAQTERELLDKRTQFESDMKRWLESWEAEKARLVEQRNLLEGQVSSLQQEVERREATLATARERVREVHSTLTRLV